MVNIVKENSYKRSNGEAAQESQKSSHKNHREEKKLRPFIEGYSGIIPNMEKPENKWRKMQSAIVTD